MSQQRKMCRQLSLHRIGIIVTVFSLVLGPG